MKVVAIIQARMASTRRPEKVLFEILGKPLIEHLITRLKAVEKLNEIVLATTEQPEDDVLEDWAQVNSYFCFRGSQDNVLSRFYQCAVKCKADVIVRVTADDPLKDPVVIAHAIELFLKDSELDYVSNTIKPSYPEGIDIEVFSFWALKQAYESAIKTSDLEHVTPYIWRHPQDFRLLNFEAKNDFSHVRLTVDYQEDLNVVSEVMTHFKDQPLVGYQEIVEYLKCNPEISAVNSSILRNEGYLQSTINEELNER